MIAGYNDFKLGSTDVQKIFQGTTLIWERVNLSLAGFVSYGYMDSASACSASTSVEMNGVYSQSGYIELDKPLYWNPDGTAILIDGFYKEENGNVIEIKNAKVFNASVWCEPTSNPTPPPSGGGGGGTGGGEELEPV
jgi:hypothetical protein